MSRFLILFLLVLTSFNADALDYALYGADNCILASTPATYGTRSAILRCPLPIEHVGADKKIRVRIYTLPEQLASECHIAGNTSAVQTYYRFSKFFKVKDLKRKNDGLIYEATLGGDGHFVSSSEGLTWKLTYEIQCSVATQPFLHSYSVIQSQSHGAWVMY